MSTSTAIVWLGTDIPFIKQSPALVKARMLLAHGAGIPMDHSFMECLAGQLVASGVEVIRFEFPYMAVRRKTGKKGFPDKPEALLNCWERVFHHFYTQEVPYVIAGKSLGGRMATILAARNSKVEYCVCFGYPFHPVGKPLILRTQHFAGMACPTLIVQGTRDAFGSEDEVAGYPLGAIAVHWLDECDHDFKPSRKSSLTAAETIKSAVNSVLGFIDCSEE